MRRAFRRAWWALTLTCGVSLVPTADAQWSDPVNPPVRSHSQAEISSNRALEIQVELAWLGDPVTFPCQMAAHAGPSGMEVRGYVPSAAVRDRALQVARRTCSLPPVDRLYINAAVAEHPKHTKANQLQYSIASCLRSNFATQLDGLKATCNDEGKVTISGTIDSAENKLSVSQHLRHIPGCTAICNQLRVPGDMGEPAFNATYTMVPDAQPRLAPVPNHTAANIPVATAPKSTSFAEAARTQEPRPPVPPAFAVTNAPKLDPMASARMQPAPIRQVSSSSAASSPYSPISVPESKAVMPPPLFAQVPVQETWKPSVAIATTNHPTVVPSPAVKGDPAKSPPMPPGVVAGNLGDPYVTTGVVILSDAEPTPAPVLPQPTTANHLSSQVVKSAIEHTCGSNIHNVLVVVEPDNKVSIQFSAPTEAQGQSCIDRIQAMPELGPYRLDIKVTAEK